MNSKFFSFLFLGIACGATVFAQNSPGKYSWSNLPTAQLPSFKSDTLRITNFGAVADGITLNTRSINEAITACSKKGGGVVLIPGGLWLTGPIELKSNVNLHLVRDAVLLFSPDINQYPLVEANFEGRRSARCQSPLFATNTENVAITGRGVIDGNGDVWRPVKKDKLTENEWKKRVEYGGELSQDGRTWYPSQMSKVAEETKRGSAMSEGQSLKDFEDIKNYLRPNLLFLNGCRKVLLEGVTFQNSPGWCLHPMLCEELTLRNLLVKNPDYAQNGDGMDIESCKNVLVEGCTLDVGDDGICIKSGKDEEGRKRNKPTENVVIRNNLVYKAHGGFTIGSEMSGGAKNIFVYNCSFLGSDVGLRFKTARGRGGVVENIYIKDVHMKDISGAAIYFDMYYFTKPPAAGQEVLIPAVTEETPSFRNFYINNIVCNGAEQGIFIRGLPEMSVKNIFLNDITLQAVKGVDLIEASNIQLNNVNLLSDKNDPAVYLENANDIVLDSIKYNSKTTRFINVNGKRSGSIKLSNTKLPETAESIQFNNGANASMFSKIK
ncbi:glycoside hydrolase family 28 protein [Pinibacter soli]|uniref:Glycoside hydrolase family 28 protein n=1 Tax=Pinibacter soli TaxID=3044211 RepID=A0ABT6RGB4_9BACT|nr:glycoside hydrolase family 28 protein [Pinibacter soli]MDI3320909.1 glycoside hydrolase family 28 protein [Pinibacter soli]